MLHYFKFFGVLPVMEKHSLVKLLVVESMSCCGYKDHMAYFTFQVLTRVVLVDPGAI